MILLGVILLKKDCLTAQGILSSLSLRHMAAFIFIFSYNNLFLFFGLFLSLLFYLYLLTIYLS